VIAHPWVTAGGGENYRKIERCFSWACFMTCFRIKPRTKSSRLDGEKSSKCFARYRSKQVNACIPLHLVHVRELTVLRPEWQALTNRKTLSVTNVQWCAMTWRSLDLGGAVSTCRPSAAPGVAWPSVAGFSGFCRNADLMRNSILGSSCKCDPDLTAMWSDNLDRTPLEAARG